MGLGNLLFNGVVELLAIVLAVSSVSDWLRVKQMSYLLLAAVCFLVG